MKRQVHATSDEAEATSQLVTRVLRPRIKSTLQTDTNKRNCSTSSPRSTSTSSTIATTPNQARIFQSCLKLSPSELSGASPRSTTSFVLLQTLGSLELDDERLSSITKSTTEMLIDLSGKKINYKDPRKAIVFVCHSQNIHWNLIRVIRYPSPVLELYDSMGKPTNRHGGLNYRQVPRQVIEWLDVCCPLSDGKSWLTVGYSAITKQQQFTNFDCGVACLLYAEKCGQEQSKEEINNFTNQDNITEYRRTLRNFTNTMSGLCIDLIV